VEVILLDKIRRLGALGDKVNVKPGFARNYLIPQGKACYATKPNIEKFQERRRELEAASADRQQQAEVRQEKIQSLAVISIRMKASEEGKLYGSVTSRDIAEAMAKAGVEVEKREIRLPQGVLRLVGDYEIDIDLGSDIVAIAKVQIVAES
jgi:large subunit ribosomal protein L9